MASATCPRCSQPRQGELRFCPHCGFDYQSVPRVVFRRVPAQPTEPSPRAATEPSSLTGTTEVSTRRRWTRRRIAVIAGGVLALVAVVSALASPDDEPASAAASTTPTERAAVDPTQEPTPEPTRRPTPTPHPTPEPTPVPTPKPLTWNELFAAAENVSYDELFRNSDNHVGDLVYFMGEVTQVLGERGSWEMRISVTPSEFGFWDDPVYVFYTGNKRFLEEDIVEFIGYYADVVTYESVLGGDITIPSVLAERNRLAP